MSAVVKLDYSYSDETVVVNGKRVTFSIRIEKCLVTPLGLVVLLDRNVGKTQNVVMLGADGKTIWEIDEFGESDGGRPHSYTGIYLNEDGHLEVLSPLGYLCEVNMATGHLDYCHYTPC